MTEYVQFPENIVNGVAKFGGILAALRGLMIVMNYINRRQFERKVARFLANQKSQAEGLKESSEPAGSSSASDIYKRKTLHIQDEDINANESLIKESTTRPPLGLPATEGVEIKQRYSIEMFEDLIQTVAKLKKRVSELESAVMHLS